MRLLNLISPTLCIILLSSLSVHAIVQKDHLIARWSFDEGNGTIVQNSVTGGSPLFMNLGNWGEEEDGNALSNIQWMSARNWLCNSGRRQKISSHFFLHSSLVQSTVYLMTCPAYKLNQPTILISFRLIQEEPAWKPFRAEGLSSQYGSTGSVYFPLNQWNCFLSSYGTHLRSFINGKNVGRASRNPTKR